MIHSTRYASANSPSSVAASATRLWTPVRNGSRRGRTDGAVAIPAIRVAGAGGSETGSGAALDLGPPAVDRATGGGTQNPDRDRRRRRRRPRTRAQAWRALRPQAPRHHPRREEPHAHLEAAAARGGGGIARRQSGRGRLPQPLPPLGLPLFLRPLRGDRPRCARDPDRAAARRRWQRDDRATPRALRLPRARDGIRRQ